MDDESLVDWVDQMLRHLADDDMHWTLTGFRGNVYATIMCKSDSPTEISFSVTTDLSDSVELVRARACQAVLMFQMLRDG